MQPPVSSPLPAVIPHHPSADTRSSLPLEHIGRSCMCMFRCVAHPPTRVCLQCLTILHARLRSISFRSTGGLWYHDVTVHGNWRVNFIKKSVQPVRACCRCTAHMQTSSVAALNTHTHANTLQCDTPVGIGQTRARRPRHNHASSAGAETETDLQGLLEPRTKETENDKGTGHVAELV